MWTTQLNKDAIAFTNEAKRVAGWDSVLRDSTRNILELSDNVSKLLLQEHDVEQTLGSVNAYQNDLVHSLELIEQNIDAVFSHPQNASPNDADAQREQAFQTALTIDHRLTAISGALDEIVRDLNAAQEQQQQGGVLGEIVGIMNAHYETLSWLEGEASSVESEVRQIIGE